MNFWFSRKRTKEPVRNNRQRSSIILLVGMVGGFVLFLQWRWLGDNKTLFAPFSIQRIHCEVCAKTGRVPDPEVNNALVMCPSCYGIGYHTIRRFDEAEVLCPACLGMGRLEDKDGAWRTCRRCDGRGLIRSGAEAEEREEHSTSNSAFRIQESEF